MDGNNRTHLFDPNGKLTDEEIGWAQYAGRMPFNRCRITPKLVEGANCKTLILGEIGAKKHLIYARITRNEDEEEGTGKMPHVLLDTAFELGAEPHVVRINLNDGGKYLSFKYWGIEEVTAALKSNVPEYQAILLKGKTARDFLRMKKKPDVISLEIQSFIHPRKPEIKVLDPVLKINGQKPSAHVDFCSLLDSVYGSDEFSIFTCECGFPECAGIDREISVVSQDGLVVWKVYYPKPCRIFVFDEKAYQNEILIKLEQLADLLGQEGYMHQKDYYELWFDLEHLVGPVVNNLKTALSGAKERIKNNGIFYYSDGPTLTAYRKEKDAEASQE